MSIRIELADGVGRVTLARPEKRNAFTGQMLTALRRAFDKLGEDEACRVIVLAGEGKAFCAGADLGWMAEQASQGREGNVASARSMGAVFHAIASCPKPVVARVQGPTMGGGNGLACAADITVASEAASFALSEVRLGLVPGVISPFVVRRVGPSWARALFLLGEKVPAREAARVGLVHYVTAGASPDDTAALDARVEALVASLVKGSPDAQQRCKRLVEAVQYQEPAEVLDVSAQFIAEARESADAREGIMAFLEKRPAAWIPGAGADAAEGA